MRKDNIHSPLAVYLLSKKRWKNHLYVLNIGRGGPTMQKQTYMVSNGNMHFYFCHWNQFICSSRKCWISLFLFFCALNATSTCSRTKHLFVPSWSVSVILSTKTNGGSLLSHHLMSALTCRYKLHWKPAVSHQRRRKIEDNSPRMHTYKRGSPRRPRGSRLNVTLTPSVMRKSRLSAF